jgi:hypothetical protein
VPLQGASPKSVPKCVLGISGGAAQPPGSRSLSCSGSSHVETPPLPTRFARRPLPARGERLGRPPCGYFQKSTSAAYSCQHPAVPA